MTQQRWFCRTCQREWVYARNWTPEDGCPGCHSSQVERVEFQAAFPGGDIPRGVAALEIGPEDIDADTDERLSGSRPLDIVQPPPAALMAATTRTAEKNDPIW